MCLSTSNAFVCCVKLLERTSFLSLDSSSSGSLSRYCLSPTNAFAGLRTHASSSSSAAGFFPDDFKPYP